MTHPYSHDKQKQQHKPGSIYSALPMLNLSEGFSASSPKEANIPPPHPQKSQGAPGFPTVFTGIPNPVLLGYISKQCHFIPFTGNWFRTSQPLSFTWSSLNLPERCSCCCTIARCRGSPQDEGLGEVTSGRQRVKGLTQDWARQPL